MVNLHLRIVHLNHVPQLSEKLGVLATIQVINGSTKDLANGEFDDLATSSRWRLTSVALCDPPNSTTVAVAFKKITGLGELSVGTDLQQVADAVI